ncbi:hypothetical protein B0I35DRAFT_447306 [Stachybotrys elegans]|uniref:AAA+ ATPase domain-containing protein n=1 Tax=Stachybotrys elegans TaxID=80388 RepID=A0A8K0SB21_9HYPO|nr:hypothetical protein B0I35DRAFT_447306 [Stachybotrys elegans]
MPLCNSPTICSHSKMTSTSAEAVVVGMAKAEDAAQLSTPRGTDDTVDSAVSLHPLATANKHGTSDENSEVGEEKRDEKNTEDVSADRASTSPPDNNERTMPRAKLLKKNKYDGGEDTDSGASSEDDLKETPHYREFMIEESAHLNTNILYQAYITRLEKNRAVPAHGEQEKKSSKAPTMVRGVIDYVRTLEERIQKLEAAEMERLRKGKRTDDDEINVFNEPNPTNEWGDLLLEVKFFHAEGEFNNDGGWQDNLHRKGSYQCNLDPKSLIRVLYNWAEGAESKRLNNGQRPDPDDIDILALGIMSEPIAGFFKNRLGLEADKSNLVRIGKPFRPLIRNLKPLKEHLAKLEMDFGPTDGKSTEIAGVAAKDASVKDRTYSAELDNVLPFSTMSDETKEPEKYATAEALVHFRYLVEFVDKYLAKALNLYQKLRDGDEDKIAYENLWMLFDKGDMIFCPSHEGGRIMTRLGDGHTIKPRYVPQLFSVLGIIGGLPKRKTLAPRQTSAEQDVFSNSLLSEIFLTANGSVKLQQENPSRGFGIPPYQRSKNSFTPMYVVCFHIDFDGVKYGAVREIFALKPHDGLVDIRDLEVFPAQYLKSGPERPFRGSEESGMDKFLRRGRKFIDATAVSHLSYEGLTVGKSREEINSAVIVDLKLAFQEYQDAFHDKDNIVPKFTSLVGELPSTSNAEVFEFATNSCNEVWCHKADCLSEKYYELNPEQLEKIESKIKGLLEDYEAEKLYQQHSLEDFKKYMEEHELIMLLPGVVPGFALRHRKWVQLNLDQLSELQQGLDWDKLVLPPGHREMVQAMVETHTRGSQASRWADENPREKVEMDLVRGKGRGCIILLHGVPGVGKTSTAECVAAYTQRPLYPITCGDIGYVPEAVEQNMEQHFKLAHRWGCVLLLDEADVFLAKRIKEDVKRNGLVSVFLRILEYYSGILFLTTNRVGAIDDAFRSRLHLTLYYPKLTQKQTEKIWKNNLERLKAINQGRETNNQPPIEFDKKKILKWVKLNWQTLQWNGRQIRNAFQTAVALAEFAAKHNDTEAARTPSKRGKKENDRKPGTPIMEVKHLAHIADASLQFSEYLVATHGEDEDASAKREKSRLASFMPKVKLKDLEETESSSSSSSSSDSSSEAESSDDSAVENSSEESSDESENGNKKKKTKKQVRKELKKEQSRTKINKEGKKEKGKESDKKRSK